MISIAISMGTVASKLCVSLGIVAMSVLAGGGDNLVDCVVQVLFIISCDEASCAMEKDFAQKRKTTNHGDLEGPMYVRRWTTRQRLGIYLLVILLDVCIIACDRSQSGPRLLVAGLLILLVARHIGSIGRPACMTDLIVRLSTAILETILQQTRQAAAVVLRPTQTSRPQENLAVTISPAFCFIGGGLAVIFVTAMFTAPQWSLPCCQHVPDRLVTRGVHMKRAEKSAWIIGFSGPLLAAALTFAFTLLIAYIKDRNSDRQTEATPAASDPSATGTTGADSDTAQPSIELNELSLATSEQSSREESMNAQTPMYELEVMMPAIPTHNERPESEQPEAMDEPQTTAPFGPAESSSATLPNGGVCQGHSDTAIFVAATIDASGRL